MIQNYFEGFTIYLQSISLAFDKKFVRYLIYTGILGFVLGIFFFAGIFYTGWDACQDIYTKWSETEGFLSKAGLMIKEIFPLFLLLLISFVLFKSLVLIACGPILSKLSAAIDHSLTGKSEDLSGSISHQIQRTIRFSVWSSIREIMFTLLCLPLHLVPGVGSIAATVLIFMIQSYYAGANYMDFILERRGLNAKDSIKIIRSEKARVIGVGSGFMLLLFIPIVGFILAPTIAVIASTTSFIQKVKG